jgi:class 3 adenylate cyclase
VEKFQELLRRYEEADGEAAQAPVEAELWRTFGVEGTVTVMDMAGFSLLTLRHGVVHYLAMVRRMQRIVRPVVERHGGSVVKFEADNCFARFPEVEPAIAAAVDVHRAFIHLNALLDDRSDISVATGVDFGRFLLVDGGRDYFGSPVNLASKLGEDLAQPGEILVSSEAMARVSQLPDLGQETVRATVSGLDLVAVRILW